MRIIGFMCLIFLYTQNLQAFLLIDSLENPVKAEHVTLNGHQCFYKHRTHSSSQQVVAIATGALLGIGKIPREECGYTKLDRQETAYKVTSFEREGYYFHLYLFEEGRFRSQISLRPVYNNDVFTQLKVVSAFGGRVVTDRPPDFGVLSFQADPSFTSFFGLMKGKGVSHNVDISDVRLRPCKKNKRCFLNITTDRFMMSKDDAGVALLDDQGNLIGLAVPGKDFTVPDVDVEDIKNFVNIKPQPMDESRIPRFIQEALTEWKMCHPYTRFVFCSELMLMSYLMMNTPLCQNRVLCSLTPAVGLIFTMRMNNVLNHFIASKTNFNSIDHFFRMREGYKMYRARIDPENRHILENLDGDPRTYHFACITPAVKAWVDSHVSTCRWAN